MACATLGSSRAGPSGVRPAITLRRRSRRGWFLDTRRAPTQPDEPRDAEDEQTETDPGVHPESCDLVRRVDAQKRLEEEPTERVERHIRGDGLTAAPTERPLPPHERREDQHAVDR